MPKRQATQEGSESVSKKKKWELNAKNLAITYSRCDVPTQEMFDWLKDVFNPEAICVAQEHHKDGGLHLHVYLRFENPLHIRDERKFDYKGFHPNVQGCRDVKHWTKYISKCNNFLTTDNIEFSSNWDELIQAPTKEEFIEKLKKNKPREYILNLQKIEYYANKRYSIRKNKRAILPLDSFNMAPITDFSKAIVILGKAMTGKTEYARAHFKNPLEIQHLDQFKEPIPSDVDAFIFDDMCFTHLPFSTVRYLLNMDTVTIHCRNTVGTIPGGIPRIFTANKYELSEVFFGPNFNQLEKESIIERTKVIRVFSPLYNVQE